MTSPSASPRRLAAASHIEDEIAALQAEMDRLREQRRRLEERQEALLQQDTSAAWPGGDHQGTSKKQRSQQVTPGGASSGPRFQRSYSHTSAPPTTPQYHDPLGANDSVPIPPEKVRLSARKRDIYVEMKEAMRKSWERDSTLVSGYFVGTLKDRERGTFPRQQRFQRPVGTTGMYYLSSDVETMQSGRVKGKREVLSVSVRGREGANVNSHWNDSLGGGAPGPGAYTPRYLGLSKR
jgi:hypothetical protein